MFLPLEVSAIHATGPAYFMLLYFVTLTIFGEDYAFAVASILL
jgi:hypothetical protein